MRIRLLLPLLILVASLPAATALAAPKPAATTAAPQNITANSAVVTGTVNPRGTATTAYFQYGTTPAYGTRTPDQAVGSGKSVVAVNATLTGLTANTVYHYRVVAVSSVGKTQGADRTFRTAGGAPAVVPEPSKLELARATISRKARTIDILAPITARASGNVSLELYAAGIRHRWTAPIDSANGRIRNTERIPAAQAKMGTGILTIAYAGDPDTRPQVVRLRAANRHAFLNVSRPTLVKGRLQAQGTISSLARGIVRVQLEYFSNGVTTTLEKFATIAAGHWTLDTQLSKDEQRAIATRRGTVHSYILFTGYLPVRMRGEMQSYQVLGAP